MNRTKRSLLVCAVSLLLFVSFVIACFAAAADFSSVWQGGVSTQLEGTGTETDPYLIKSGDDLALFAQMVAQGNTFDGEYVVLCSDIDMGSNNVTDNDGKLLFYPIGFDARSVYIKDKHGVFSGTFDGRGHHISSIYQNVEQLRGVYKDTQYNAAMGLFGHVEDATIKNLFIGNFTIGGADTDAGCVAAYASGTCTFENIALVGNSVYTADGSAAGIVGFDMAAQAGRASSFTFRNITIDASNSIGALDGSWDVHVGGLVGYLSADSSLSMSGCHTAQMTDVNISPDGEYVGAGMFIGSVGRHTGSVLDTALVCAEECSVYFTDPAFDQLFAGYGYGITPVRLGELGGIAEGSGEPYFNSKFVAEDIEVVTGTTLRLGELFSVDASAFPIKSENVYLYINGAGVTYTQDTQSWNESTLVFSDVGSVEIVICDYYFCKTTTVVVDVVEPTPEKKFEYKFQNTDDYTYRVGNSNTVTLGTLFAAIDGSEIDTQSVSVTVTKQDGAMSVGGVYTQNASDWTKSTLQFSGNGIVDVTITDDRYCVPTILTLEVVDAVNTTGAASATSSNVVLLADAGFSSLEVSGGYTLYGNGFTLTCSSDVAATDMGYAFLTLRDGTLDNVSIVCPSFSYPILYNTNKTDIGNLSVTDSSGKTRYYNIRSAILATGNNTIVNSYVSGGRVALYLTSGTTTLDNSTICGGAAANVQVTPSAGRLILRDATLIQKPIAASVHDTSEILMGFSVIAMCDDSGNSAPITIEGSFCQYAWADESDSKYVPSTGQSLISTIMSNTDYVHSIDGVASVNLGFAYLPSEERNPINDPVITDNRTDKDRVVYETTAVSYYGYDLAKIYSYKNTGSTDASFITEPTYAPAGHRPIAPQLQFADADANKVLASEFDSTSGKWISKLTVNLDAGAYSFSFADLALSKYGVGYDYSVLDENGNEVNKNTATSLAVGTHSYTLIYDVDGGSYELAFVIIATKTSITGPELISTVWGSGVCVASSYGGTWHGAAPALDGISIKYWSTADSAYKTITLSDYTPASSGKLNGTNNTYTLTGPDFTLAMTGGQVHSGNNVYAMPVVCDGTLYFLPAASNGLVNSGNSARSVSVSYVFKDNATDETLTFSHTWSIEEKKDDQYGYSDFCKGTKTKLEQGSGGSGSCVTPDTLITLADGTQKRVDELTGEELLLVWNLETGKYDAAPIVFVDIESESEYEVIRLYFSDGREVGVIYEHGFFDIDLGEYVYITADNYHAYIGDRFVVMGDIAEGSWEEAVLCDVELQTEVTSAWSPVTARHLCYYTNGVLSMPGGISGLFNIFEVDTDKMMYDEQKKQQYIETYGLFTYEDFDSMITPEAFYVFNGEYLKIAIGRGMLTWEDIAYMAERYIPLM